MKPIIGMVAWVLLGLFGLFSTVDLGFGPILICPQCGKGLNVFFGIVVMVIAVAAIVTNRKTVTKG
jgi:hypothetical protein